MKLNKLSLKDKEIFDKCLSFSQHELSVYAFPNIYIWGKLFDIEWVIIEESLCVFFKDKFSCFLYLAPLGRGLKPQIFERVFLIMDSYNKNPEISRIENIEEKDRDFYRSLGYDCKMKSSDYLCARSVLANLSGDKFKSKRASANYFTKNYAHEFYPLSLNDRGRCLDLYDKWMRERKAHNPDPVYQGMLKDSRLSLNEALNNYRRLGFSGGIVRVDKKLKGFTFGFELNKETFCILYEITDLSIKGLAQFIFREFSRVLKDYKFINIMDDSGLENLKKVKLSYQPQRLIPAYIVTRDKR